MSLREALFEATEVYAHDADIDYEDNHPVASKGWETLKGRCLSGDDGVEMGMGRSLSKKEEVEVGLSAPWFLQRAVNMTLQRVFVKSDGKAWYELDIGFDRTDGMARVQCLIMVVSFGGIVYFPLVYISATYRMARAVLCPDSEPAIRAVMEVDFKRYLWTFLSCIRYALVGSFPFFMFAFGDTCDCFQTIGVTECPADTFRLPCLTLCLPWFCVVLVTFCFIHRVFDSALDCQCGVQQEKYIRRFPQYEDAFREIIEKLSDPKDPKSFFPTFVNEKTASEVDAIPISRMMEMRINFCAVAIGCIPVIWVIHEDNISDITALEITAMLVGCIGFVVEFRMLMVFFEDVLERFEEAVDELLLGAYVAAAKQSREQPRLRKLWRDARIRTSSFRVEWEQKLIEQSSYFRDITDSRALFPTAEDLDADPQRDAPLHVVYPELQGLADRAVAFNFSQNGGVMLYRMFRDWLRFDMLNERSGLELFMTFTLPLILLCVGIWVLQYLLHSKGLVKKSVSMVFLPAIALILFFDINRALAQCVKANDYMFEWPTRLLFLWQDYAVSKESGFHPRQEPGWIWDTDEGKAKPLTLGKAPKHLRVECSSDNFVGIYAWVSNFKGSPVYMNIMKHKTGVIYKSSTHDKSWIIAEGGHDTVDRLVYDGREPLDDWKYLGQATDNAIPATDGWSKPPKQGGGPAFDVEVSVFNLSETVEDADIIGGHNEELMRVDRMLANTIQMINVLQDKQTLFGISITRNLQNSCFLGLASFSMTLSKQAYSYFKIYLEGGREHGS